MKPSNELFRAISQADYSYVKEILLEHQIPALPENAEFSFLEQAAQVFKKNPKIYFELLKYNHLYTKQDLSIFTLINQKILSPEVFEELAIYFDYPKLKNKFGYNLANFAIMQQNWEIIYYCIQKDIQPAIINSDHSVELIFLNFKNCNLSNDKIKYMKEKIKSNFNFSFLEQHFSIKNLMDLSIQPIDPQFFKQNNEQEFISYLFNYNTKSTRKIFYEFVINKEKKVINYHLISLLKIIKECKISHENAINFILNHDKKNINNYEENSENIINIILHLLKNNIINEKKALNIIEQQINSDNIHLLPDTESMLLQVQSIGIQLKNNFKNMKELHDILTKICRKIQQENYLFPSQIDIEEAMKSEISKINSALSSEALTLHFPKNNHELIDIGQELSICVGAGHHCQQILSKEIFILILKDLNNHSKYCISATNINRTKRLSNQNYFFQIHQELFGTIIEASGQFNHSMPKHIKELIQSYLYKI